MRKTMTRVIMAIVVFNIVFVGLRFKLRRYVYDSGDTPDIMRTSSTIKYVLLCMDIMLRDGYEHPITMEMVKEYAQKNDVKGVTTKIYKDEICDEWDMPILLFFEKPLKYTFISYGPNKKYDDGKGDDIVR